MPTDTYEPTDRRPIASRERKIWQRIAAFLGARHVSANSISVWGMIVAIGAGVCLWATPYVERQWLQRVLWLSAAIGIQLRLIANMLDGMVALESRTASPLGELFNELPDRVSDLAIIIGAGYAVGGIPELGYLAASVAVLTAYVRAVGKATGASNLFIGPMAKPHRMFVLTVIAVLMAVLPRDWLPSWGRQGAGLSALALGIIIFGGLLTIVRRLALIVRHLQKK